MSKSYCVDFQLLKQTHLLSLEHDSWRSSLFFADHGSQSIDVFFKTWVSFFPVGDIFVFQLLWCFKNGHAIHPALKESWLESFDKCGWTFFPSSSWTLYILSWKAIGWKFLATPQKDGREHHHFTKKNSIFSWPLSFFLGDTSSVRQEWTPFGCFEISEISSATRGCDSPKIRGSQNPIWQVFETAKTKTSFSTVDFVGVPHFFTYSM